MMVGKNSCAHLARETKLRKHEAMSEKWLGVETKTSPYFKKKKGVKKGSKYLLYLSAMSAILI